MRNEKDTYVAHTFAWRPQPQPVVHLNPRPSAPGAPTPRQSANESLGQDDEGGTTAGDWFADALEELLDEYLRDPEADQHDLIDDFIEDGASDPSDEDVFPVESFFYSRQILRDRWCYYISRLPLLSVLLVLLCMF